MAEFFVLRKYRRQGLGRDAAQTIFRRLPGPWTVRQQLTNPAATAFWRRAIPHSFTESDDGIEVTQRFEAIV
jgi:predicted acetyltransferase